MNNLVMCHHHVSENSTCSNWLQDTNQEIKTINKDANCSLIYNGKYLQTTGMSNDRRNLINYGI